MGDDHDDHSDHSHWYDWDDWHDYFKHNINWNEYDVIDSNHYRKHSDVIDPIDTIIIQEESNESYDGDVKKATNKGEKVEEFNEGDSPIYNIRDNFENLNLSNINIRFKRNSIGMRLIDNIIRSGDERDDFW